MLITSQHRLLRELWAGTHSDPLGLGVGAQAALGDTGSNLDGSGPMGLGVGLNTCVGVGVASGGGLGSEVGVSSMSLSAKNNVAYMMDASQATADGVEDGHSRADRWGTCVVRHLKSVESVQSHAASVNSVEMSRNTLNGLGDDKRSEQANATRPLTVTDKVSTGAKNVEDRRSSSAAVGRDGVGSGRPLLEDSSADRKRARTADKDGSERVRVSRYASFSTGRNTNRFEMDATTNGPVTGNGKDTGLYCPGVVCVRERVNNALV
ncbi:hypothetical protein SARC_08819 [Sphaeroforma arctica JP610]|uniref:Uncharacterized protein n=1 Tax=Sphaeroforma arctica JP610 TaxID=667725 RepID=A0A0L0FPX4_9EUKA|nr:hypothetical protein SARC_08819 [Sphaeroforma arctica JP610]KNC78764.1 hypothetical protein SARC_08819 [Sphaeroforma arctica JP610]|eukprot:XP_014152666.1 hypothetical protein SARC_08819 [Sphaeroforma arctica JP610]